MLIMYILSDFYHFGVIYLLGVITGVILYSNIFADKMKSRIIEHLNNKNQEKRESINHLIKNKYGK